MRVKKETRRWYCFSSSTTARSKCVGEDVAHDAHGEVGLLEDHGRGLGLLDALLEHLVELEQVLQLALEVVALGALGRGADDRAAAAEVELGRLLAQAVALLVVEPARDADALAGGRVDHVAPGDRELHRQARALGLQRVLDDLDDDLLPGLEQVGDAAPVAAPAPAARDLDARQHDLVDVQEAVLLEADVDEGGLESGEDVVDLALVDVADDRARAAALDVELGDALALPPGSRGAAPAAAACGSRGRRVAGGLEQRDARLRAVDADQYLLFQVVFSPSCACLGDEGPAPCAMTASLRLHVDRLQAGRRPGR